MTTDGSTHKQCVVCHVQLEQPPGMVGRNSKYCPNCSQPKAKSPRDTSTPEVVRNSRLLSRAW